MIQVIDTKTNNLSNVLRALTACGYQYEVIYTASQLRSESVVVLPGVGAFSSCMASLSASGFCSALKTHLAKGGKLLGICVGMQALAQYSTEFGQHSGMGLLDAQVEHLAATATVPAITPNVNWLPLQVNSDRFAAFNDKQVYFVHSYHMCHFRQPDLIAASVDYAGQQVCAIVDQGNIIGFQFHPEKSGEIGLELLAHSVSLLQNHEAVRLSHTA